MLIDVTRCQTKESKLTTPGDGSELLSVSQLASYLGMAERTIFLWAQQNKLPAFKLGSMWRFRRSDIDAWLETQRSGPDVSSFESISITNPIEPPISIKQKEDEEKTNQEALIEICISYIYELLEEKERSVWIIDPIEQRFGKDCANEAIKRLVKKKEIMTKDIKDNEGQKIKTINRR
tara:strand:- start:27 stop:560 length:534 start_codon:yes stop_codon:yes gene_type:complete